MLDFLRNLPLRKKLLLSFLTLSIIPFITLGIIALSYSGVALEKETIGLLESIREIKKTQLEMYFRERIGDMEVFTKTIESFQVEKIQDLAKFRSFFIIFQKQYGYSDILLMDKTGYCFYSTAEKSDRDTNLVNGVYRNSNLGRSVQSAMLEKKYVISDFEPYAPSRNKPAAFIVYPIIDSDTFQVKMVFALQLSLATINAFMQLREGMGETGESYLVGQNGLVRSDLFLDKTCTVENAFADPEKYRIDTMAVKSALAGKTDTQEILDYRNEKVLSSYAPIQVSEDITWAIITEIDENEAFSAVSNIRRAIFLLGGIGILVILFVGYAISRQIGMPIMAAVAQLAAASEQLANASQQMATSSQQISQGSVEQASTLEEISSSLEEMTSMTKQNAENCTGTEKMSNNTKGSADTGRGKLQYLAEAFDDLQKNSEEMEKILKNIQEIAMQTNMLSLNAAVEAARAGEHGRGFAVVADEVRSLAQKSAELSKTTNRMILDNSAKIRECNKDVKESATLFQEIFGETSKVHELIGEIAAASHEQAQGLDQVTKSIIDMDKVVQENASTSEEQASISEELNSQAENLNAIIQSLAQSIGASLHR